jgi:hypothetical protein
MHEVLANLGPGPRVLDLGSGAGSFDSSAGPFVAIRTDPQESPDNRSNGRD